MMALDHASAAWNSGRSMFEADLPPIESVAYTSIPQQIVREVTHICAPGFQLLAGMGLAISVRRRQLAGASELYISGDMILRAVVLFVCEWVLLHVPMGQGWFFFAVLCSIGSAAARMRRATSLCGCVSAEGESAIEGATAGEGEAVGRGEVVGRGESRLARTAASADARACWMAACRSPCVSYQRAAFWCSCSASAGDRAGRRTSAKRRW